MNPSAELLCYPLEALSFEMGCGVKHSFETRAATR